MAQPSGSHAKDGASSQRRKQSSAPRRRPAGTTGSLSATNPNRKRTGTTGSLSATNASRVRSGQTNAGQGVPQSKSSKSKGLIIGGIVAAVVLVLVGGFFFVRGILHPYEGARVDDGQTVTVVIPEGADGTTIIQSLLDAGVIHSSKDFRRALAEQNADQSLRSGTYTFKTGSDPADVVRQLVSGSNTQEGLLAVPEGLTITQTAQLVEQATGISSAEFLERAKASNFVAEFPFLKEVSNDSLEGYLYPKTYDLSGKNASADEVLRLMLAQSQTELSALDLESARKELYNRYGLNATNYDIIKIASIIEEEAINEDDRGKVSSVFYNRLSNNMALQSDATMGYETGGAISAEDLQSMSPYNTYMYKGLPPTPICSPSEWAINAAMHPDDTKYLFFFIIEAGDYSNHTFTETFEEHSAAYNAALKEQAAATNSAAPTQTTTQTSTQTPAQGTITTNETTTSTEGVATDTATDAMTQGTTEVVDAEEWV